MKKTRKIAIALLTLTCAVASAGAIACDSNGNDKPKTEIGVSGIPENAYTLTLDYEQLTLTVYQTAWISAYYNGEGEVVWNSARKEVAEVVDGKIVAKSVGTTEITATVNGQSAACTVVVEPIAIEKLSVDAGENTEVYVGDTLSLSPVLEYDGKALNGGTFTYLSSATEIVEVDGSGKITAKKIGTATVNVSAVFDGKEVGASVKIDVVSVGKIEIVNERIALDASGGEGYTTRRDVVIKVYEKGVEKTENVNVVLEGEAGQDVFTLEGKTVVAKNAGVAKLTATYTASDGEKVSETVSVVVSPVRQKLSKDALAVNMQKGYVVDSEDLFGENAQIVGATILNDGYETAISVKENNELSFDGIALYGEQALLLKTRNVEYEVNAVLWTAILETPSDLACLLEASTGYYQLGDDIDASALTWQYEKGVSVAFNGLLDGNGKAVLGLRVNGSHGLFQSLGDGACIQNLTLKNFVSSAESVGVGALAANAFGNVLVENVRVDVALGGTLSGGLFGKLANGSAVELKDVSVYAYSATDEESNGALVALAASCPTFENTKAYSQLQLCSTYEHDENLSTAYEEINRQSIRVEPKEYEGEIDIASVTADGKSFATGESDVKEVIVFGNSIKYLSVIEDGFTLYREDVLGKSAQKIEAVMLKEDGTEAYYSIRVFGYRIRQANVDELLTIESNAVISLEEDVDLENRTWNSTVDFKGVFDGNGRSISNLKASSEFAKGGLFEYFNGTIKNVSFKNVSIANASGAIAGQAATTGNALLENVFVSASNSLGGNCGGAFGRHTNTSTTITYKNVFVYLPDTAITTVGFLTGFQGRKEIVENCYFVGGNQLVNGNKQATMKGEDGEEAVLGENYFLYDTIVEFLEALNEGQIKLTEELKAAVDASFALKRITQANVEELMTLTYEIVLLEEDVDLAEIDWKPQTTFTGVFDGQNHAIKNLTTTSTGTDGGLFKRFEGTLKNVAILNATVNGQNGAIAGSVGNALLNNVFVTIKNALGENAGGLFGRTGTTLTTVTLTDTFVYMPETTAAVNKTGFVTGFLNRNLWLTNCVFVGGNGGVGTNGLNAINNTKPTDFDLSNTVFASIEEVKTAIAQSKLSMSEFIKAQFESAYPNTNG